MNARPRFLPLFASVLAALGLVLVAFAAAADQGSGSSGSGRGSGSSGGQGDPAKDNRTRGNSTEDGDDEDDDDNETRQGPGNHTPRGPKERDNETHDDDDDDDNETSRGHGSDEDRRGDDREGRKQGHVLVENATVDGRFVRFGFDLDAGLITDYTVGDSLFFTQVEAPGAFEEADADGSKVEFEGEGEEDYELRITDNPTGHLRVKAENATFRFTLASGVNATANGSHVKITLGNVTASFTNATIEGGHVLASHAVFHLHGRSVAAMAHSDKDQRIDAAIAKKKVAARVEVLQNGTEVLDYEDAHVKPTKAKNGTHRFIIDANFTEGRTFVVEFAPGLLKAKDLGILYYDEVNGTLEPADINRADDLEDVLDPQAGEGAEYWIVHDANGVQVLVAVPHFSVHAFDVYAITPAAMPSIILGLAGAIVFVLVLAAVMVAGRRRED